MPDAGVVTALAAGEWVDCWCVAVGLSSPILATNYGQPITVTGDEYTPRDLRVQVTRQLVGGTVVVDLDDDGTIEETEDGEDCRGCTLEVFRVFRLSTGDVVESHWIGTVERVSVSDDGLRVQFHGGAAEQLRVGPATPETDDRCVHDFKGLGCTYAGATATCDGSLASCQAMAGGSNELNFVSASWAPLPGTVVIWDGTPYYVPGSTAGANVNAQASQAGAPPPLGNGAGATGHGLVGTGASS